jgi:diguanylate cyclase (GGDEF)-like protein
MIYAVLLAIASVHFLTYLYSLRPEVTFAVDLMLVVLYVLFRGHFTSCKKSLAKLSKDHGRLRLIYESERRDTEILHILDEISASFMDDRNLKTIFEHTLDGVQQVLKTDISVLEIPAEKDSVVVDTKLVRGSETFELNENIYAKVLGRGSSLLINNLSRRHSEYEKYESLHEQGVQSFLVAPLKIENKPIGLLGIFAVSRHDFTGEELRLLTAFANHGSLIIENARLLETRRRLSVTDELTGLHNFRYFRERFMDEFERARRYSHDLSLLMCDIDYFKNYNDANGHEAGNEVLKKLSGIMASAVRDVDFVARYGGEEFVILLAETGKDNASVFAERLRKKVEEEAFPLQEKQPNRNLTITIGIANFPHDAETSEELITRADQALYSGKKAGRNRIVNYSS